MPDSFVYNPIWESVMIGIMLTVTGYKWWYRIIVMPYTRLNVYTGCTTGSVTFLRNDTKYYEGAVHYTMLNSQENQSRA